jgi:ABC-type amino acid transport substrate-binding protein
MSRSRIALLALAAVMAGACGGGGAGPSASRAPGTSAASSAAATSAAATSAAATSAAATSAAATTAAATTAAASSAPASASASASAPAGDPNDLLAKIKAAGEIKVSTDPNYAPQSFLKPDGTFEGFDIDVANEIGKRLGVKVKFETPNFDLVVAGGWQGRWDISVGSVTVTKPRLDVLDFTEPYYFTPAQMAASTKSGITTLEGLAGKAVCVGSSTTYQQWLEGSLELGDQSTAAPVPTGATAAPLETDQLCAQAIKSRGEYDGLAQLLDDGPGGDRRRHADRRRRRPGVLRAARRGHRQGRSAARRAAGRAGSDRHRDARRRHAQRDEQEVVRRARPDEEDLTDTSTRIVATRSTAS